MTLADLLSWQPAETINLNGRGSTVKLSQILNKGTLHCVNGDVKAKNYIFINITGRFVRHVAEFTGMATFQKSGRKTEVLLFIWVLLS